MDWINLTGPLATIFCRLSVVFCLLRILAFTPVCMPGNQEQLVSPLFWIPLIGAALGYVWFCWYAGSCLMSPAPARLPPPPTDLPIASITLSTRTGNRLAAWHLRHESPVGTVILLHQLRGNRSDMLGRARLFFGAGYNVLLPDLQAHGESTGRHISAGFRESMDVQCIVDYARQQQSPGDVFLVGWSLGGAAAVLANPQGVCAMVLESVYASIERGVHNRVASRLGVLHHILAPCLLVQLWPRLGIRTAQLRPAERIADVTCPVLILAGDRDLHTRPRDTHELFRAANEPKQLHFFSGAGHVNLYEHEPEGYERVVLSFFAERGNCNLRKTYASASPAS